MNKEEAIKWLKDMKFEDDENCSENEALDIGIKAVELCEVWNGIHGQIVAVEGTFDRIWNDSDKEEQEPCGDCISREAVLDIVEKEQFKGDALSEIEKLPSVNPQEPKTGHWNYTDAYPHWVCCDKCKTRFIPNKEWIKAYNIPTNYCPNCGCRMESEG